MRELMESESALVAGGNALDTTTGSFVAGGSFQDCVTSRSVASVRGGAMPNPVVFFLCGGLSQILESLRIPD